MLTSSRKNFYLIFILLMIGSCSVIGCNPVHSSLKESDNNNKREKFKKGIVRVESKKSKGTGFIIHATPKEAYIVTLAHVIEGDNNPTIEFHENKEFKAKFLGAAENSHPDRNIALLLVKGEIPNDILIFYISKEHNFIANEDAFTFGFPSGKRWIHDNLSYSGKDGGELIFSPRLDKNGGNSGGPLIRNNEIVGIITRVWLEKTFADSVQTIRETLEGLKGGETVIKEMDKRGSTKFLSSIEQPTTTKTTKLSVLVNEGGKVLGNGISCPKDCTKNYDSGKVIELTATPLPGYKFEHWEDALNGSDTPVNVTMNSDKTVKAIFSLKYGITKPNPKPGLFPELIEFPGLNISISIYEITFEQYNHFCKKTGHPLPEVPIKYNNLKSNINPVIYVSWNDAMAYAKWLAKLSGDDYRLPTKKEWEYAASGGRGYAPDKIPHISENVCAYANVADQTAYRDRTIHSEMNRHECNDGYAYTAPVNAENFKPSFGLYHMIGNVWEWLDCNPPSLKEESIQNNQKCLVRGGAWDSSPHGIYKERVYPPERTQNNIGFRVVKVLKSR